MPLRQQRKTVFYISPGVSINASMSPFEALPSPFSTFQNGCETQKHDALMDTFRRAQLANVTISAVDPNGLGAKSYPDFLRAIAENTGGRAVVHDNDPELQVGRLLAESRAYYLLGFEPAPHKADGRFHRIQVHVAGRDVQVRAVLDSQGRSFGSRRLTLRLGLNRASGRDLHYEILPRLPVSPGRYEVRLAVRTGDARTGSVYAFVDVPDFSRARVSLSGLVVAASPSGTAAPSDAYAGLLPVVPTARRVFRPTDRVTVFARGYQGGRHALVSTTATARIVDAANHEVFNIETPLVAESFGAQRSADYRLAVPVDQLGPGYYLLTVSLSAASGSFERSLSFQIQ